jgi:hypothetical protein
MVDGTTYNATITNEDFTFFEVIGDPDYYNMFIFTLCQQGIKGISERIEVWDDNGVIETFNQSNAEPGGKPLNLEDGCSGLRTSYIVIGTKSNGET